MGIAKKIVIVMGIIVVALLLFSFIYNVSQPTQDESLNVISDDGSIHETASYPYTVVITYDGSWYAEMGNPNYLVKENGDGNKSFILDCAAWERIVVDVHKEDFGEGNMKVQLFRNGEVVAENSTTNPTGNIIINYNY